MTFGRAYAIFENIENLPASDEEKGLAIRMILNMETHNSVKKADMLKVIEWLWNRCFDIKPMHLNRLGGSTGETIR